MSRSLPFAFAFIIPALAALGVVAGGAWLVVPPVFLFVITPMMDLFSGLSKDDLEPESAADKWRDLRYDAWLWLWVPVQLVVLVIAVVAAGQGTRSPLELVGMAVATGLMGGVGINVAHELMHRKGKPERAAAEVLMTSVGYAHFCVEHVLGHHKNVATPGDGASARKGEIVFAFVARSVWMGLASAWRLETSRVRKLGIRPLSLRDRRLRYPLVLGLVVAFAALTGGAAGVAVFLGQCAVAVVLLEVINYVEHYGLARKELTAGVYERVQPEHSWSSAHRLTNWYLFHLPRHADHHAHASRPYFSLRHMEGAPQLPAGYATMLLLALVPPMWRAVMDPRVDAWNDRRSSPTSGTARLPV